MATKKTTTNTRKKTTKKTTTNTGKKTTKKAEPKIKYWNSGITGACTVFGNEFEYGRGKNKKSFIKYSTTISRLEDGEYTNMYINVKFKKDEAPGDEGMFKIFIKNGFLSFSEDKEGHKYVDLVVMDYTSDDIEDEDDEDEDDEDEE